MADGPKSLLSRMKNGSSVILRILSRVDRLKWRQKLLFFVRTYSPFPKGFQRLPQYAYPRELESIAAIHVTRFKDWWDKLSSVTRKNVRRAEKRGVVTKIVEFSDQLVRDIVEFNGRTDPPDSVKQIGLRLTLTPTLTEHSISSRFRSLRRNSRFSVHTQFHWQFL